MIPVDLQPQVNDGFADEFKDRQIEVDGVPFCLPQGPENQLSLRQAEWIGWNDAINPYGEAYQSAFADAL